MSDVPEVTHPPVSHPKTITLGVISDGATKAPDRTPTGRSSRRGRRVPSPRVIGAVVLVVAAAELLLWQVGGPVWGIVLHAVIAAVLLSVLAVLLVWRRRRAAGRSGARRLGAGRQGAGSVAGRAASGGLPGGRSRLGRLFAGRGAGSGARAGRSGTGGVSGGRRGRGLLGKLTGVGGRHGGSRRAGRSAGSGGGSRLRGARFGWGRKSPAATSGTASGSGAGRRSAGRLLRNPFTGGRRASGAGGRSGGAGSGSGTRSARGAGHAHKRRSAVLADFLRGVRQGTQPKPAAGANPARHLKASPEPTSSNPAPADKSPVDKPAGRAEEMVRQAVTQASDAAVAPEPPPDTGGNSVGDMNKVRAAADELAAALKEYDPATMHQLVREMPHLGEALTAVAGGFRHLATRAESEWPIAGQVVEGLRSIATDVKNGAGTAEAARAQLHKQNETDVERGEAPRKGSRQVESRWDVGRE